MAYNITNITEANTYPEIIKATNELTGGLYAALILFALFMIVFIVFKNHETKAVFVGNSFFVSVVAALMFFGGFIPWHILVIPVLLLFGSLMYLIFGG
jgi:hypothetical protein